MSIKLELHRIFKDRQKFDVPLFMLPILLHKTNNRNQNHIESVHIVVRQKGINME
jgi:hypothetical protein